MASAKRVRVEVCKKMMEEMSLQGAKKKIAARTRAEIDNLTGQWPKIAYHMVHDICAFIVSYIHDICAFIVSYIL